MDKGLFETKLVRTIALSTVILVCGGCQDATETQSININGSTERADTSQIAWTIENLQESKSNKILLIAQGSGCAPARTSPNITLMAKAASNYATLTVEKYGVKITDAPKNPYADCSAALFENHTITQRVSDVQAVLSDIKSQGILNDELVLFGGSEGGAVVSILSHEVAEADAVVVFSTGTGMTMAEFFPMVVPPTLAAEMQTVFDTLRANPVAEGMAAGNSYKWWADILDRRLSDDLLKSKIPILLVHGENDQSGPVESARATRDAFAAADEADRLTYWELQNRDHQMIDSVGESHMQETLTDIVGWIED